MTSFAYGKRTPTHGSHGSPKRSERREPLSAPRNAARKRETVAVTARTVGARHTSVNAQFSVVRISVVTSSRCKAAGGSDDLASKAPRQRR